MNGGPVAIKPKQTTGAMLNKSTTQSKTCNVCVLYLQKDCPSGELSRKKFLSIYNTLFPEGKAGAFYEHVFRTFDEDGSGKIDFQEFLQVRLDLFDFNVDLFTGS